MASSKLVNFLSGTKVLEEVESPVNGKLTVIRDFAWGTYILGGGLPQSGGLAKAIWKKSLREVHRTKDIVHSCLVLGLGGGGIARVVSKNWPNAKIVGVDVDPVIVGLGKKYLDLGKLKVDIKIQDAFEFCKKSYALYPMSYDLVCVDTYVGDQFPKKFESEQFLKLILKLLSDDGVAVFNRLYYDDKRPQAMKFAKKLEGIFSKVDYFYPEANIMFICRK